MLYRLIGLVNNRGLAQEKEPGQDGLGDKDGRNAQVELPLLCFVPEEIHAKKRADAAADNGQPDEGVLRDAPLPLPGLPLVNPEDQEGQKIDADEIDDECSHGRLNADPVRYDLSMQM